MKMRHKNEYIVRHGRWYIVTNIGYTIVAPAMNSAPVVSLVVYLLIAVVAVSSLPEDDPEGEYAFHDLKTPARRTNCKEPTRKESFGDVMECGDLCYFAAINIDANTLIRLTVKSGFIKYTLRYNIQSNCKSKQTIVGILQILVCDILVEKTCAHNSAHTYIDKHQTGWIAPKP